MLKITINKRELRRIQTALKSIKLEATKQLVSGGGSFNKLCAIDYNQLLLKNIFSRATPVPSYTKKYQAWKAKHSLMGYPAPWRLTGDLVNALGIFRHSEGWASGLQANTFSSGRLKGKSDISAYARAEERRRPIFAPTTLEYGNGLRLKRTSELLNGIAKGWQ